MVEEERDTVQGGDGSVTRNRGDDGDDENLLRPGVVTKRVTAMHAKRMDTSPRTAAHRDDDNERHKNNQKRHATHHSEREQRACRAWQHALVTIYTPPPPP